MEKFLKYLPLQFSLLFLVVLLQFPTVVASIEVPNETLACPEGDGWVKVVGNTPSYASSTEKITEICVMGEGSWGNSKHYFNKDGYSPYERVTGQEEVVANCWGVSGIGTSSAQAQRNQEICCPSISYASFKTEKLEPLCGEYEGNYTYDINDWPAKGAFCEIGYSEPKNPVFPAQGEKTTWECILNIGVERVASAVKPIEDIRKVTCTAEREEKPVLTCGDYATDYAYDINDWPAEGEFCEVGVIDGDEPEFPAQGESATWNCILDSEEKELKTYTNEVNNVEEIECEAKRATEPEVLAEEDEVEEKEPKKEVLAAATVAITDTAGGNTSSVIAMQVILLISLVSAIWSYIEGERILPTLGKRK